MVVDGVPTEPVDGVPGDTDDDHPTQTHHEEIDADRPELSGGEKRQELLVG